MIVSCHKCLGKGRVVYYTAAAKYGQPSTRSETFCDLCGGSGQLHEDPPPATRKSDPDTSYAAEQREKRSGRLTAARAAVLRLVEAYPASTYSELERHSQAFLGGGIDKHTIMKRLCDLERLEYVARQAPRECAITGNKCAVWVPAA